MLDVTISAFCLLCAAVPAGLFFRNLQAYRLPPHPHRDDDSRPEVSILIPARNEAGSIGAAVRAALASEGVRHEVLVLDDGSQDATAAIVQELAEADSRARLAEAPALAGDWCGKQRACAALAEQAAFDRLLFLDADVVLKPDAAIRAIEFLESSRAALVSGIPKQTTETFAERLLIPLIHFVLLGFLPIARMRRSAHPAYSAGCGQLLLTTREAYRRAGGHAAIRRSLHDGVMLPRAFRTAGMMTDLFDATGIASCRMYRSAAEVWNGLQKNAIEGLAAPRLIVPITLVLLCGQAIPFGLIIAGMLGVISPLATVIAAFAAILSLLPRVASAVRFHQSWQGALLHPFGVMLLLAIQWSAFARWLVGSPVRWKGRGYVGERVPYRERAPLSAYNVKISH